MVSVLQMQSLENVRKAILKKNLWRWTFIILANKALYDDSFLVNFSNISAQPF